jgi:hypothetical protein
MMFPVEYHALIQEYRRADLVQDAERERLARVAQLGHVQRSWQDVTKSVVCRLPVPALEPVCAA